MTSRAPLQTKQMPLPSCKANTGQSPQQLAASAGPQARSLTALQMLADKSATVQRLRDVAPVQRIEEEEMLQGKTIQRIEEEELMQGKSIQRVEEEELLQGKAIQRLEDEEDLLQGKAVQRVEAQAPRPNNTGMPDTLKSGIENLAGMSMDHVRVHRNSDKPAQVDAHAYAQGSAIHLAAGQERHLPHEAWHVVQQAQGRVKPTMQMKGVAVNDDVGLEAEADVMGAKALSVTGSHSDSLAPTSGSATQLRSDVMLQLVLTDGSNKGRAKERNLIDAYHAAEKSAKKILLENGGNWTRDILTRAIVSWQAAADLRVQAGALHEDQDGGHLDAIAFCRNQVDFLNGLLATRRE